MKTISPRLASLAAIALIAIPANATAQSKPAGVPPSPAPASGTATTSPTTPTYTAPTAPAGSGIQTPMDDLGLRKEAVPPALLEAVENVYSLQGLNQCSQIVTAVQALDVALGKDIDLPQAGGSRLAASDLVNFAASSVIPFRGLIRQVSGASSRQRQMQEAVLAGFARRAFLKGYGRANYCDYPARPASLQIITTQNEALIASLEPLCGPLPPGQKRTPKEEWLNSRKCIEYKRALELKATIEAPSTPASAPASPAPAPARSN